MEKKRRLRLSLFSVLVLLVIVGVGIGWFPGTWNSLFKKNVQTTLYAKMAAGEEPQLRAEDYFSDPELDYEKFSFDLSGLEKDVPGVYFIPVLYDGKETNCTVELTVIGNETEDAKDDTLESGKTYLENAEKP
ncbi:MAG: ty transcription activator TEC1 [Eubacteriales bacterium]|nr:ty transcription activator TEC1 [Eubacteriales bacterium]